MSTEIHTSRWSRPLAGIGLVAVIGAGLGAFFGIRAVQGAGSPPATGQPAARTGAAMAYDAANGTIVLFGGQGRSRSFSDTWIWDGSTWSEAHPATSPPPLSGAQMTYDPATHDVLLVGGQRVDGLTFGPIACAAGSGSSSSGSVSGSSGSTGKSHPPSATIPDISIPPGIAPAPSATAIGSSVGPACAVSTSQNTATWLWNGRDWTKTGGGANPFGGFIPGTLATDPVSGRVLLLATGPFPYPEPMIACPVQTPANPDVKVRCASFPIREPDWTWNGHAWKALPTPRPGTVVDSIGSPVIVDAVTGRLAVFGGQFIAPTPARCPTCMTGGGSVAVAPIGTVSTWDGTAWKRVASFTNGPSWLGGMFAGDSAAHNDVYLSPDGQTWLWTGTWKRVHPSATPPLAGAAIAYDATTKQVVLFGGFGRDSSGLYDQTWTWDGSTWTMRGGSAGPSVRIPLPTPVSVPPGPPCIVEPVATAPAAAAAGAKPSPPPHVICPGGGPIPVKPSGTVPGTPVNASGIGVSTGVAAP